MGNQLVSSVKTVIKPIDYYLSEVPEFKFRCSLGQTQFLKVALCVHSEGDVVVKVLSHEDPSLLLEAYKRELVAFARLTASNVSIASFRVVELKPNFAYIARQFVRFSLYDRLSTRPFLTHIEKCWIVYQLFKCIGWCHERRIRHGDIKLENILITSSLWVVITDFATYKPISLPEDNPSYFNYFFDTSRRRCCNIAPERFVSSNLTQMDNLGPAPSQFSSQMSSSFASLSTTTTTATNMENSNNGGTQQLTDQMDMFSIGCVLAEIFSDQVLFDLSGLLYYKENKFDRVEASLKQISNDTIRELVANLTSLEPNSRKSCDQVLTELRGSLFPCYFDKLHCLMSTLVRLSPDTKIHYLSREIELYLSAILKENPKGVLILLTAITTCLRSLKHLCCKIEAQRLIVHLVKSWPGAMSPFITDRLVPYLAYYFQDEDHRVRGEAIMSITELLEQVTRLATSDNNLFTDYLLEMLIKQIVNDKSAYVRLCLTRCIGRLSKVALAFLNQSCDHNYDEELNLLQNYFQTLVSQILTDPVNCVRRTLLLTPDNCAHLCTFFGRQKTNEVILSHIITFLNDKNDFQLRSSFFDNIVVIASYLGVQCAPILYPLLQQGLCDAEEMIIAKTINAIASLAEQGLLQKSIIYDLVRELLPLLYHPNRWITHSIVQLFFILSEHLSFIDLNCKLVPQLSPYMHRTVHSLSNKYLVLDSLNRALPRNVYDSVVDVMDPKAVESLFQVLTYRNLLRHRQPCPKLVEMDSAAYKRLLAENINDAIEQQLLGLAELMTKINRNKRNYQMAKARKDECNNVIAIKHCSAFIRSVKLLDTFTLHDETSGGSSGNQEWQHMFGPNSSQTLSAEVISDAHEVKELDFSYFECPPYSRDVRLMLAHKKSCFTPALTLPETQWTPLRPKGFLVSNLLEHKSSVNQMVRYGESPYFLTCSDDGTIRLWDLTTADNRTVINRSKYLFKMEFSNGSPINFKGLVCCGEYLVTYTNEGIVYVFESTESCLSLVCSFKAGSSKAATPLLVTSLTALSSNLFAVALTDSVIYGYDIRLLHSKHFFVPVFKLRIAPNRRTITSIDGSQVALFAATAYGFITTFDLRFNMKINYFCHQASASSSPLNSRIARIKYTPEGLYSSVYGSSEVTLWDYKLGQKDVTLVMGNRSNSDVGSAVHAMLPMYGTVITAGSDMRIRLWDLTKPERSYIISDPAYKACNYCSRKSFSSPKDVGGMHHTHPKASPHHHPITSVPPSALFDGAHSMAPTAPPPPLATFTSRLNPSDQSSTVIEEKDCSAAFAQYQSTHHCTLEHQFVGTAHHDCITDLLRVNQYLVTAGRNGTVKVWR